MPSLIWVFAGRTVTLLVLSCRGSYYREHCEAMGFNCSHDITGFVWGPTFISRFTENHRIHVMYMYIIIFHRIHYWLPLWTFFNLIKCFPQRGGLQTQGSRVRDLAFRGDWLWNNFYDHCPLCRFRKGGRQLLANVRALITVNRLGGLNLPRDSVSRLRFTIGACLVTLNLW